MALRGEPANVACSNGLMARDTAISSLTKRRCFASLEGVIFDRDATSSISRHVGYPESEVTYNTDHGGNNAAAHARPLEASKADHFRLVLVRSRARSDHRRVVGYARSARRPLFGGAEDRSGAVMCPRVREPAIEAPSPEKRIGLMKWLLYAIAQAA